MNVVTITPEITNFIVEIMELYNASRDLADNSRYEEIPWILWHTGKFMTLFLQPFLCIFGFVGNLLSVVIFLSKNMRNISSNIYLTALSGSSCCFLLVVFFVWLEVVDYPIVNTPVWCQGLVFVTYVCSFLSVWFVVCITVENYIVTFFLTKSLTYCTAFRARVVVVSLTCVAVILYSFVLWAARVVKVMGVDICTENNELPELTRIFTYVDSVLTLLVPSVVTIILVKAILVKYLYRSAHSQQNLPLTGRERSLIRITRVLFAISMTFVVLSAPSQVNKIRHLVGQTRSQFVYKQERIIQQMCQIIYYMSFCCNFVYYIIWSENYRRSCGRLFCIRVKNRSPSLASQLHTSNSKTAVTAV